MAVTIGTGNDSPLRANIAELGVFRRLSDAGHARVPPADIAFAQQSDIDPDDVGCFRQATRQYGLIVIVRCPKRGAVAWHGTFDPKRCEDGHDMEGKPVKSGVSGIGVHPERGNVFISDYDMMSMWRKVEGGGWRKVLAKDIDKGGEVQIYTAWMNGKLRSPLQHGAQDDFVPPPGGHHPNVAEDCRCAAFMEGEAIYLPDRRATQAFYVKLGLKPWPYDRNGRYIRPEDRDKYTPWGIDR